MFLTCALPSSGPVSPSSMFSSSVAPFNSTSFTSLFRTQCTAAHTLAFSAHHVVVLRFLLAWTCLPLSCHLLPVFSSVCNLIGCDNFYGQWHLMALSQKKSGTYTSPSFLSTSFSLFFLIMRYATFFPMNNSLPAWMMWDADTNGLLTSATCHVLLRTNPAGVLTDMTCCP